MALNAYLSSILKAKRVEALEHFQDFFEVRNNQDKTLGDSQPGPCNPQTAGVETSQLTSAQIQEMATLNQKVMASAFSNCPESLCIKNSAAHPGKDINIHFGESTDAFLPVGSQPLCDGLPQTPGLDLVHHGGTSPRWTEEYNLFQCLDTTPSWEDNSLGQVKTTSGDEYVCSGQKPSPTVGGSPSVPMTSVGNQTLHVDGATSPARSFGTKGQTRESSSDFPSGLGQLPQEKSHQDTQSPGTRKNSPTGRFFCTYQGCGKSYTKSFHLKDHMKKHTGQKAYVCSEPGCQWKFFRSGDLQRHKRKHGGQRLHPCARCNKNFSRLNYLKQHQRVCPGALSKPGS
uniref:Krueppel-like factor 17 n=1 Tax=Myodes glareolus TaxID=447135 RepID=UPI0020222C38|nr:Krueppel-like factor 17 [Myodes glareolus]